MSQFPKSNPHKEQIDTCTVFSSDLLFLFLRLLCSIGNTLQLFVMHLLSYCKPHNFHFNSHAICHETS